MFKVILFNKIIKNSRKKIILRKPKTLTLISKMGKKRKREERRERRRPTAQYHSTVFVNWYYN